MTINTSTVLYGSGILVFSLYFLLFTRTMNIQFAEERKQYALQSSAIRNILGSLPILAVFFLKNFWQIIIIATIALTLTAWRTKQHHIDLIKAGINPDFIRKLRLVSILAFISLILIFAGVYYENALNA